MEKKKGECNVVDEQSSSIVYVYKYYCKYRKNEKLSDDFGIRGSVIQERTGNEKKGECNVVDEQSSSIVYVYKYYCKYRKNEKLSDDFGIRGSVIQESKSSLSRNLCSVCTLIFNQNNPYILGT